MHTLSGSLMCSNLRSRIFDAYYNAYGHSSDLNATTAKSDVGMLLAQDQKLALQPLAWQQRYQNSLETIHSLLTKDLQAVKQSAMKHQLIATADSSANDDESRDVLHLIRLEMRSKIEPGYEALNKKLDAALAEATGLAQEAHLDCTQPEETSLAEESDSTHQALFGAHFTMATAYQSCQVLDLPLVDDSVGDVEGVKKWKMIDSVGWGRVYTDVALLKRTHYYHRGQTYGPQCTNQNKEPLVYDYGGVPVVGHNSLDLFTNEGGGPALGIDCSAFVSTAAAVAGNLYTPSSSNKAIYTRFVSRDFIDPEQSGWACYDSVRVNNEKSIEPGDIAAVEGHVVMVDKVGADPFGLRRISSESECSHMSYHDFDFSIIQSSPSKNSLGINRFLIKDYLPGETKMQNMFVGYAKQACRSKFDHVTRKPATSVYGIIRHNQKSSCLAPRMHLKNESCIEKCQALQN